MRRPLRLAIALSLTGLLLAADMSPLPPHRPAVAAGADTASAADPQAATFYLGELHRLQQAGIGRQGRLGELLTPLFAAATTRSAGGDPAAENRALLGLLAGWASGRTLWARDGARLADYRLTLGGRRDLGRHFLVSAAIAASGETALSHLVGLLKEIADTGSGSGFSFADIAADRAGARFGELATRSPDEARELQRRVATGLADTELLPAVGDLPENLDGTAFRARFGTPAGESYRALIAEIDRRIASLPLYAR